MRANGSAAFTFERNKAVLVETAITATGPRDDSSEFSRARKVVKGWRGK